MSNRNYVNGANFERKVKAELENKGWLCFRTAGSHGVADIIAIRHSTVPHIFQCKISNKITPGEREKLKAIAKKYECNAQIAYREKEGRKFVTKYEEVYVPE